MQIKTMMMIKLHFSKKNALTVDIYSRCFCFNWKSRNFAGINSAGLSSSSTTFLSEISAPADCLRYTHLKKQKRHRWHISFFWLNDRGTMRWANWSYYLDEWNCGQVWNIKLSKMADTSPHSFERYGTPLRLYGRVETNEAWNCKFTVPLKQCELNAADTTTNKIQGSIWFMIHFPPWFLIAFGSTFRNFKFFCLSLWLPERSRIAGRKPSDFWHIALLIAWSWLLTIVLATVSWHISFNGLSESKTIWRPHTKSKHYTNKQVVNLDCFYAACVVKQE